MLRRLFENESNRNLALEQLKFRLRNAQNDAYTAGTILSSINPTDPQTAARINQLIQLNSQIGSFLAELQQQLEYYR